MDTKLLWTGPDHPDNWFYERYYLAGNCRYYTFQIALNILNQRFPGGSIIETGCQRLEDDVGGGMSSSIFAEYVDRYGGRFTTIDNDPKHLAIAKGLLQKWPNADLRFVLSDSVAALEEMDGCDLLYLDSWDYPYGELLNAFGGQQDIVEAEEKLKALPSSYVRERFANIIGPSQEHCVKEYQAMASKMKPGSLLMIDDNQLKGGGKPGLLKPMLPDDGWTCILDSQQTLWIKE